MVEISAIDSLEIAAAPSQSEVPSAAPPPLRDLVLAGRFFGDRHGEGAEALAAFLHGGLSTWDALRAWFGTGLGRAAGRDALRAAIDRDIAEIDAALRLQLDTILHAPRLLQFEGRWRGLAWLVSGFEPSPRLNVRLPPIPRAERY